MRADAADILGHPSPAPMCEGHRRGLVSQGIGLHQASVHVTCVCTCGGCTCCARACPLLLLLMLAVDCSYTGKQKTDSHYLHDHAQNLAVAVATKTCSGAAFRIHRLVQTLRCRKTTTLSS
jgi:hypothetical protein